MYRLTLLCLLIVMLLSCSRYKEPILEPKNVWPSGLDYHSSQPSLNDSCAEISGLYSPLARKYLLINGKLVLQKKHHEVLSTFFKLLGAETREESVKGDIENEDGYFVNQSGKHLKVSFYRFDGSKKYTTELTKGEHYKCIGDDIYLGERYSSYGGDGIWVNYKQHIKLKKVKEGIVIYENLATPKGNKHYYYVFTKVEGG